MGQLQPIDGMVLLGLLVLGEGFVDSPGKEALNMAEVEQFRVVLELRRTSLLYWFMQFSLRNARTASIQNHPNYRVVKVSDRQGQVGMLVPYANLVVPDKRTIRSLRDIIRLYGQLPVATRFHKYTRLA
jgi:hypothetical protein